MPRVRPRDDVAGRRLLAVAKATRAQRKSEALPGASTIAPASANIPSADERAAETVDSGSPADRRGDVYGTIIVMSIIAPGAHAYEQHLWRLIILAGGSAVVLLLAHALGESLSLGRRITVNEVASIARREFAVIAAAIIALIALALGTTGMMERRTAVQLALWLGVTVLAVQGIRYSRLEHMHPGATLVTISLNLAIGLALVALEVLFAH